MFSVPLICSSKGVATVSAMVSGLAPGKSAVTTTDGGTTSGYSEIGNCVIAIKPARKMAIEITPAKIGRSMKNLDRFMSASSPGSGWGWRVGSGAQRHGAVFGLAVAVHHEDKALALVVADRPFRHQQRIVELAASHLDRHEH